MIASIKKRLHLLEKRLIAKILRWPTDEDEFVDALGLEPDEKKMFQRENPGGVIGYDIVEALSFTAARDWRDDEN